MTVGDQVSWVDRYAHRRFGTISAIDDDGRIHVAVSRTNMRGRVVVSEVYFDADETHRLTATLAHNLAIAGGLCAAFDLGLYNRECANVYPSVDWSPGCRWPAP